MSEKVMPYSIDAEESLLGNLLLYPESVKTAVDSGLASDDFYLDKHKRIYNLITSMYHNHEDVDIVSFGAKLRDFDYYDKIGGKDYLMRLVDSTISANNTGEYIRIIKNKSLSRQIIAAGEEIAVEAYDGSTGIDEILEKAENRILGITRSRTDADFRKGSEVFDEALKKAEKIQEAGSAITGIRTLYTDLDRITAGFQRGDLIILAARPSMGKTALALNIALNSASVTQGAIAIFSLEMPCEQLAFRMFGAKSQVPIQKIRTGKLSDSDWSLLNEANQELRSQKFFIDDTPAIKVSDMYAKARKLQNDYGLSLIVIDYIQLIQGSGSSESRQQEISEISRRLKAMARELNVPVIALSQLSRNVERRDDKRPLLSDLRESGALEQDADLVLFLYREEYYKRDENNTENEREDVELLIAKHRNGATGTVKLAFEKNINAFYSIQGE
ncbi:MAG: replicative DNA helicase [Erysipelotrichaceae bacterium]|nr:replicative DNA helicase [Erysipelotrichaceae bacterium]